MRVGACHTESRAVVKANPKPTRGTIMKNIDLLCTSLSRDTASDIPASVRKLIYDNLWKNCVNIASINVTSIVVYPIVQPAQNLWPQILIT